MGVSSLSTLKTLTSSCLETMLGQVRAKMLIRKLHAIVRTRIRLSETISLGMQSPSADFVNRSVVTSVKGGGGGDAVVSSFQRFAGHMQRLVRANDCRPRVGEQRTHACALRRRAQVTGDAMQTGDDAAAIESGHTAQVGGSVVRATNF